MKQGFSPLLFGVAIVVLILFLIGVNNKKPFDSGAFLRRIRETATNEETFFTNIRDRIPEIVNTGGSTGVIEVIRGAFAQGEIDLIHCHMLTHIAGHAVQILQTKINKNTGMYVPDLCGSGYSHGLEAQIVAENTPDVHERLYRLCATLQKDSQNTTCYEGAGHAFMEKMLNVEAAATQCDKLSSGGPVRDPYMCYKGVFAQYTNFIGGDDGETGRRYVGGPPIVLPALTPIAYCASLPDKYQLVCAHEVCGFRAIGDITRALSEAVENDYSMEMQAACVGNAAGARGESELGRAETIAVPPSVFSFPKELRHAYINGSMWGFNEYNTAGAQKDYQHFCNSFPEASDRDFCLNLALK